MPFFALQTTLSGPLFEADARGVVTDALNGAVKDLADLGDQRLHAAFPEGLPVKTGYLESQVRTAIYGPAAILDDGSVVYSSWVEGTSSRNQTTRFKGYATWRRTLDYLNNEALPDVAQSAADLIARGLGG